jgi:hypothetical protein
MCKWLDEDTEGFSSWVSFPWPQYSIVLECLVLSIWIAVYFYSVSDRLYRRTVASQSYGVLRCKWTIVILQNWSDSALMCTECALRWMEQNDSSTARSNFMQAKKKVKDPDGWEGLGKGRKESGSKERDEEVKRMNNRRLVREKSTVASEKHVASIFKAED